MDLARLAIEDVERTGRSALARRLDIVAWIADFALIWVEGIAILAVGNKTIYPVFFHVI